MERQEQLLKGSCHDDKSWYEPIKYTCTLDKAYRFLRMVTFKLLGTTHGLVNLMWFVWHPPFYHLCEKTELIALPLPSKNLPPVLWLHIVLVLQDYQAVAIISEQHFIALKTVCRGLREEKMGCIEKLQKWNQPWKRNVDLHPTDDVVPTKAEYGKENVQTYCIYSSGHKKFPFRLRCTQEIMHCIGVLFPFNLALHWSFH